MLANECRGFHLSSNKVKARSSSLFEQKQNYVANTRKMNVLVRATPPAGAHVGDGKRAIFKPAVASAAVLLLGVFSLQNQNQQAFASLSLAVSCAPEKIKVEESSSLEEKSPISEEGLSPEVQREFEQWKSVPYALTVPLKIVALRGSVPAIWLQDFTTSQGRRMKLKAEFKTNLDTIFTEMLTAIKTGEISDRSTMAADVVTVGDSWLGAAIAKGAVAPLGKAQDLEWFQRLHPRWQAILQRDSQGNVTNDGDVWGAPYRCGCMLVAYRKDKLAKAGINIKDWEDLWKPELAGKISMVNSTREVVGMVLKSLGASYNTTDLDNVPGGKEAVKQQFHRLRKQVRVFDDVNYLKALGTGDVWVAIGWSSDVLPFAKRSSNVAVIAPTSGTSLWADLWAIPANMQSEKIGGRIRGPSPMVSQWLDFCLQPARELSLQQADLGGASPFSLTRRGGSRERILGSGPRLHTNTVGGMPPRDILGRSEFLEPLNGHLVNQYKWVLDA